MNDKVVSLSAEDLKFRMIRAEQRVLELEEQLVRRQDKEAEHLKLIAHLNDDLTHGAQSADELLDKYYSELDTSIRTRSKANNLALAAIRLALACYEPEPERHPLSYMRKQEPNTKEPKQ